MKILRLKFNQVLAICGIVCLLCTITYNLCAQNTPKETCPNIIIVTLSGVRNIESIEDPTHQYIYHFWNYMRKEGVLYNNLINVNFEFHMPTVCAINFGISSPCSYFKMKASVPSILQYVRKRYNYPAYKLWTIGHWDRTAFESATHDYSQDTFPCAFSSARKNVIVSDELKDLLTKQELIFLKKFPSMTERTPGGFPYWDSVGRIHYQVFKKILSAFKPKLVHYIMSDVEGAHCDTYSRYVLALRTSDEMIFELWTWIQNDPFYKNNTYLIVNVDHARDLYYAQHNEDACGSTSRVWMYIYGPNVKKGIVIDRPIQHIDIFATVAYLMDVKTHPTKGAILKEAFADHLEKYK